VLERGWHCARAALAGFARPADLHDADIVVSASLPLPCEHDRRRHPDHAARMPRANSFGDIVEPIERPGFSVEAILATWDFTLFAARTSRCSYVSVPRRELSEFLADLHRGRLDNWFQSVIGAPHQGRVLRSHAQALERAVFDDVHPSAALAAPERDTRGRPTVARLSTTVIEEAASRGGKGLAYVSPQSYVPGDGRKRLWLLLAALAVLLIGGAAVAVAASGGENTAVATDTTEPATSIASPGTVPSTAPSATAAPTTLAPLPSVLIRTTFVRPVTTYTVVFDGPAPSSFTYAWRMIGNETPDCAARMIVDGPDDRSVTWDHPHPPCAIGSDHADTVIEVVGTSASLQFTCRFQGAAESQQPCVVTRR
jgi:hypothetical protein